MFIKTPLNRYLKISGWVFLLSLCLLGWSWQQVFAHAGGTLQLTGVPAGPYLVTAWTLPATARANTPLHVSVGIADAATDEIVLDAQIEVTVTALQPPAPPQSGPATIEQSVSKILYETADFPITHSGRYQIDIFISGSQGEGEASFEMDILPALNTTWLWVGLLGLGGMATAVLFWSWKQRASHPTATPPPRRPVKRPSVD